MEVKGGPGEAPAPKAQGLSFEEARERLRARGYLDRGVEGAVLRGALAARSRARGLLAAAAIASAFLAAALAAVQTALVSLASALPPRDAGILFLWLALGAFAVAAALVSVLMLGAWLRSRGRTDGDLASTEAGLAVGLLAGALGAAAALPVLESAGKGWAAAVLLLVAAAVFLSVRVARSVTATVLLASGRDLLLGRRAPAAIALVLALLLLAGGGAFLLSRPRTAADEPLVVTATGARVVVVGVDGWSDALPGPGTPPLPAGPAYAKATTDPAAFWTTVATGEPVSRHGVGALDLVRVSGLSSPVQPVGGTGFFLAKVLPALSLARRESVTSASRRVPAAWEVASRAGIASLAVGWWTTYPATEGGATVLSNHLYFAARSGGSLAGEGWPGDAASRAARLVPTSPETSASAASAAPGSPAALVRDATGLDAFLREAFQEESAALRPRLSFVYQPGLDILAAALGSPGRSAEERVALAEALRAEAGEVSRFVAALPQRTGASLVVVLLDGGRGSGQGRVALLGPLAGAGGGTLRVRPEDLAPTVLAALGVPASREAGGRVATGLLAPGTWDGREVATWGRRERGRIPPVDPREYVENLKSLGYLK